MREIKIRDADLNDAERLLEIYGYYVLNTAITFEYDVPSLEDFKKRMSRIMQKYPFLVIEEDGRIQGYTHARPFVNVAAYNWSCETTIYLDKDVLKRGFGRKLYDALEAKLKKMGILNLYARIAYPEIEDMYLTKNSAQFHEHLGFKKVGEFHKCGYKFGRCYNMICMEKIIGEHTDYPELKLYPELDD